MLLHFIKKKKCKKKKKNPTENKKTREMRTTKNDEKVNIKILWPSEEEYEAGRELTGMPVVTTKLPCTTDSGTENVTCLAVLAVSNKTWIVSSNVCVCPPNSFVYL